MHTSPSQLWSKGLLAVCIMCSAVVFGCQGNSTENVSAELWSDPSPHEISFVTVAPGVDLEVADWGGDGPTMVFLAGLGNTLHAYDDFAPRFLDEFRVLAITRRGFGASTHPESGYDQPTLAQDVLKVMESKQIDKAILLGHSIAAVELTELGSSHPDRVHSLVYLDTYCNIPEAQSLLTSLYSSLPEGMPEAIQPTATDIATVEPYISFVHQSRRVNIPEADIRARFTHDGWNEEAGLGYKAVWETMLSSPLLCSGVGVPALAVISDRNEIAQEEPWVQQDTAAWPAQLEFQQKYGEIVQMMVDQLPAVIANSKVVTIQGGHHWVFTSHADEVERQIREFLK